MKAELSLQIPKRNQEAASTTSVSRVHHLFEAQVERSPEAIAISDGESLVTYKELNERANQLSAYLKDRGLSPGSLCGVALYRSIDMFVSVLAILKAGAGYVPLDPCFPDERLGFMIEDTQMRMLLSERDIAKKIIATSTTLIRIETERENIARSTRSNPKVKDTGPAYVVFTSGSTGKPKGLVMGHAPLVNLLEWQRESSELAGNGKTTVQFASLSFDVSFQEMFSTWNVGGRLILVSEELRRDLRGLWHLLISQQVERIFLPPVVLRHLALAAEKETDAPTSLREVITAGEQLRITPQIRRMFARLPNCTLHNQYGPSESHVVTSYRLSGDPESWGELTPIGIPITNVEVYVLDDHLQPVDQGVAGELYLGGVCLSDGYLNRPGLTEEKFIRSPFHEEGVDSEAVTHRLYKTGDLARALPDGNIEFLGRIDHQIKVRGHRIEAGEVEAAMVSHSAIRDAIVTGREDARGERQLVGYFVATDVAPSNAELRTHLARTLPVFMIPSAFVQLDSVPLTPTGKVNRGALPSLSHERPTLHHLVANASNDIENQLVQIWERVLNIHPVGVMDNFFELGGDSLMVIAMLIEINEAFGRNLPASTLLTDGTIKALAKTLGSEAQQTNSPIVAIQPLGTRTPLFLLPPIGGEVLGYRNVAQYLGSDQPVYGISACGLNGDGPPLRDLVQMAARHVDELLSFRPEEPFIIGGYSFGGTLAFEMAQQLYAKGYRDIKVIIIDEEAPLPRKMNLTSLKNVALNLPHWFVDHVVRRPPQELKLSVKGNVAKVLRLARSAVHDQTEANQENYQAQISEFLDLSAMSEQHIAVSTAMWEALLNYHPKIYPGRLLLIRTRAQRILSTSGWDKGWKQLAAQGVEIRVVEGNHNTLAEGKNAQGLAQQLTSLLNMSITIFVALEHMVLPMA